LPFNDNSVDFGGVGGGAGAAPSMLWNRFQQLYPRIFGALGVERGAIGRVKFTLRVSVIVATLADRPASRENQRAMMMAQTNFFAPLKK
jgi:hypothetical protein